VNGADRYFLKRLVQHVPKVNTTTYLNPPLPLFFPFFLSSSRGLGIVRWRRSEVGTRQSLQIGSRLCTLRRRLARPLCAWPKVQRRSMLSAYRSRRRPLSYLAGCGIVQAIQVPNNLPTLEHMFACLAPSMAVRQQFLVCSAFISRPWKR
jgi:hypothetical protein